MLPTPSPHKRLGLMAYALPPITFSEPTTPLPLQPIWDALRVLDIPTAEKTLSAFPLANHSPPVQAAALAARAAALAARADAHCAAELAEASLALHPNQWMAHRVLLSLMVSRHAYGEAIAYLGRLPTLQSTLAGDEPLSLREQLTALAAWHCRLEAWDEAQACLARAYPQGVATMPVALQNDWFRLALYQQHLPDALVAAQSLITCSPVPEQDIILQVLVQQGWSDEALSLYEQAYTAAPESELLRRRLVGLYIRKQQYEHARSLLATTPLSIAA